MFFPRRGEVGGGELEPIDPVVGEFSEVGVELIRTNAVDLEFGIARDGDVPTFFFEDRNGVLDKGGHQDIPIVDPTFGEEGGAVSGRDVEIEGTGRSESVYSKEGEDGITLAPGIARNVIDRLFL